MAKNIEININNGLNSYEVLYPKIDLTNNQGTSLPISSTSGSINITDRTTGTLTISRGGTGVTSYSSLANQLQSYFYIPTIEIKSYIGTGSTSGSQTIYFSNKTGLKIGLVYWTPFPVARASYTNGTDESTSGSETNYAMPQFFVPEKSNEQFNFYYIRGSNFNKLQKYIGISSVTISSVQMWSLSGNTFTIDRDRTTNVSETTYYCIAFYIQS